VLKERVRAAEAETAAQAAAVKEGTEREAALRSELQTAVASGSMLKGELNAALQTTKRMEADMRTKFGGRMPLLFGTVSKKGSSFPHPWQFRYCVVYEEGRELVYYAHEGDVCNEEKVKGRVKLSNVSVSTEGKFGLELATAAKGRRHSKVDELRVESNKLSIRLVDQAQFDQWRMLLQRMLQGPERPTEAAGGDGLAAPGVAGGVSGGTSPRQDVSNPVVLG
jgi:hypothetical protein